MALGFVADHVNGRGVFQLKRFSQVAFGIDFSSELALRIDHEWQIHFMIGSKLFRELAQVSGKDFRLVLEDVVAKV